MLNNLADVVAWQSLLFGVFEVPRCFNLARFRARISEAEMAIT